MKPGIAYRVRPGAYAILPRGGSVLLTHQAKPQSELQLPGGGIDPYESPIEALHREVFEETGWRISGPRKLGLYRRFTWMPEYEIWAEKVCHIFLARPVIKISLPTEEGHEAIWASPEVAREFLASEGDREFLAKVI